VIVANLRLPNFPLRVTGRRTARLQAITGALPLYPPQRTSVVDPRQLSIHAEGDIIGRVRRSSLISKGVPSDAPHNWCYPARMRPARSRILSNIADRI
jgi:hypothetical protein